MLFHTRFVTTCTMVVSRTWGACDCWAARAELATVGLHVQSRRFMATKFASIESSCTGAASLCGRARRSLPLQQGRVEVITTCAVINIMSEHVGELRADPEPNQSWAKLFQELVLNQNQSWTKEQ